MTDRPLRVMLVAGDLSWGGAEKQAAYHARALTEHGVDTTVVALADGGHYAGELQRAGVRLATAGTRGRLGRAARIAALARRVRPDFVQSTHTFSNLYAWAAARASGALSIGALRGDVPTSLQANGRLARAQLRYPDAIVANSRRGARELAEMRRRGIHFLENVIDIAALDRASSPRRRLRDLAGASDDDVLVLGLGTINAHKAFDRFLRVFEAARLRCSRLRAVIVGDGPGLRGLEAARGRSPVLSEALTLAGRHDGASTLMRGADLYFMTSDHEGAPNALIEAMAAGLPSVVTPAGDAGRFVDASASGLVCDFADEGGLAEALVTLASRDADRRAMGARARAFARAEFDCALLWPRLSGIYRDIAERAGRTAVTRRVPAGAPRP